MAVNDIESSLNMKKQRLVECRKIIKYGKMIYINLQTICPFLNSGKRTLTNV